MFVDINKNTALLSSIMNGNFYHMTSGHLPSHNDINDINVSNVSNKNTLILLNTLVLNNVSR